MAKLSKFGDFIIKAVFLCKVIINYSKIKFSKFVNRTEVFIICLNSGYLWTSKFDKEFSFFFFFKVRFRQSLSWFKFTLSFGKGCIFNSIKSGHQVHFVYFNFLLTKLCIKLIKFIYNKLWNFNFLIKIYICSISFFCFFTSIFIRNAFITWFIKFFRCCNCHFFSVINKVNHFYNILVLHSIVAIVFKHGTNFKNANIWFLLSFWQIIEEERNNIKCSSDSGNNNQNTKKRKQNIINIIKCGWWINKVILTVCKLVCKHLGKCLLSPRKNPWHQTGITCYFFCNFSCHTVFFLKSRQYTCCNKSDNTTDCSNCCKHTVNTLTGFILLIITNICLNWRVENMSKRTYNSIEIQTCHYCPNYIIFNITVCSGSAEEERIHT